MIDVRSDIGFFDPRQVDCVPILQRIAEVNKELGRPAAERQSAADALSREFRHRPVPLRTLIAFITVPSDQSPYPEYQEQADLASAMILCDPLFREIISRQYLAAHPETR